MQERGLGQEDSQGFEDKSCKGLKGTPFTWGGALGYACWATLGAATAPPSGQR